MCNCTIDKYIDKYKAEPSSLIQILLEIQNEYHWLPQDALKRVGEKLRVPLNRILHIATFYKAFSLVPKGRHEVNVCMGTACHVRGATRVLDKLSELTGIEFMERINKVHPNTVKMFSRLLVVNSFPRKQPLCISIIKDISFLFYWLQKLCSVFCCQLGYPLHDLSQRNHLYLTGGARLDLYRAVSQAFF